LKLNEFVKFGAALYHHEYLPEKPADYRVVNLHDDDNSDGQRW